VVVVGPLFPSLSSLSIVSTLGLELSAYFLSLLIVKEGALSYPMAHPSHSELLSGRSLLLVSSNPSPCRSPSRNATARSHPFLSSLGNPRSSFHRRTPPFQHRSLIVLAMRREIHPHPATHCFFFYDRSLSLIAPSSSPPSTLFSMRARLPRTSPLFFSLRHDETEAYFSDGRHGRHALSPIRYSSPLFWGIKDLFM